MTILIPQLTLRNPLNGDREHWAAKSRRANREHDTVWYSLLAATPVRCVPPCIVTMTRLYSGRGQAHDRDGLTAAFKHVRDTIAEWLKVDDAERFGVKWDCDQERGEMPGVRIEIQEIARAG